jgi:glycosyltransferase involved in cell wall biosynthesis
MGRFEEAIAHFKAAVRLAPGETALHQWLISAMLAWADQQPAPATPLAPGMPGGPSLPLISVIVCTINPDKFARLRANLESCVAPGSLEIIAITDARSMCEGYNRGARRAAGDILVFCHDDIRILTPDFAHRIVGHLGANDLLGVAGGRSVRDATWGAAGLPYTRGQVLHMLAHRRGVTYSAFGIDGPVSGGMQALDGLFLAMRPDTWERMGFDEEYDGFHLYDIDFSFRCHLAGGRVAVCNEILVEHHSLGSFDERWKRAAARFVERFGERFDQGPRGIMACTSFLLRDTARAQQLHRAFLQFGYGTDIDVPTLAPG